MPSGGKGATAKIYIETEVIDNFKEQAAKIKSGLGKGIKEIKDLDLNFGFNEKSMAEAASKELEGVMNIMTSEKLNRLDFSGIIPPMVEMLKNNSGSVKDEIKLQVIQGLREGFENLGSVASSIDIDYLARNKKSLVPTLLGSTAIKDIIQSLGLSEEGSKNFREQFKTTMSLGIGSNGNKIAQEGFAKDIAQLLSLKATRNAGYNDVLKYLVSGTYRNSRGKDIPIFEADEISEALDTFELKKKGEKGKLTENDVKNFAGYLERLKYLAEMAKATGKDENATKYLEDKYESIVDNPTYNSLLRIFKKSGDANLLEIFTNTREKVAEANKEKDRQYNDIDWRSFSSNWEETLDKLIVAAGDENTLGKILPTLKGWDGKSKQFTADELLTETIQYMQRETGIEELDNLLKDNQRKEQELRNKQQGQKPIETKATSESKQQGSSSEVSSAQEASDLQKARGDLEKERTALEQEIQRSTETMNEAEHNITAIDKNIEQTKQTAERNNKKADELIEKKEQIEFQIQQTENELKTIKERLQDAVDAKESAEKEIEILEEKLLNADDFGIISTDSSESADKYNQLKTEKHQVDWDLEFSRDILEEDLQKQKEIEEILNNSYSTKTLPEAYKQAMTKKKEFLQLQKEYEKIPAPSEQFGIDEIGSSDYMMAAYKRQQKNLEVNKAWMAFYKSYQEFESHGQNNSGRKKTMQDRLLSGLEGGELPVNTSWLAETVPSELEEELKRLNEIIEDRKKEVEETQKKADELQQQIDELSSHLITTDSVSKQLEQKKQEKERFEQEESDLATQQTNKQAELNSLQEQLNGTKGVENHLKATKTAQQNSHEELQLLQQQRDEQQRIYDDAKRIQEESLQRQAEIDRMIAEVESREQQPPATTPAGAQERDSTQTDDIYQKTLQEFNETKTKLDHLKEERERIRSEIQGILASTLGEEHSSAVIRNEHGLQDYQREIEEYKTQLQQLNQQQEELQTVIEEGYSTNGKRDARALLKQKKEDYEKAWRAQENSLGQMTSPLEKNEASYNFDKAWIEYYKAFQEAQKKAVNKDWLKKQAIVEEDPMHFSEETYQNIVGHIQQSSQGYKQEIEKSISEQESLIEQAQNRLSRLREKERELFNNSDDYQSLTNKKNQVDQEITQLQEALEQKRKLLKSIEQGEVESEAHTNQPPLSSSGTQTVDGVQQEGAEANNAADKMKALADAKKEALEANQKLAESADTTTNAIRNESNAGNFDELISKLIEAAKLLAQLPQSFEGFKGFDLEPLNNLSQAIQQFPKEGFNISLGEEFDNLSQKIGKALDKMTELTSQVQTEEISKGIAEKYDAQIQKLTEDAKVAKEAIEELQRTNEALKKSISTTAVSKKEEITPYPEDKQIAKEYEHLKEAQDKVFKANNIQEYNAALEEVHNTLQSIKQLEEQAMLAHASQSDLMFMAFDETPSKDYLNRFPETMAAKADTTNNIRTVAKDYIEKQKAEIQAMADAIKSMNIDAVEKEMQGSNWNKKRVSAYNDIIEGANAASTAIEVLNKNLDEMSTKGVDPQIIESFLTLKESTQSLIAETQGKNDIFTKDVESAKDNLISKLDTAQKRLEAIKKDSGKLINIDPTMQGALDKVEEHLKKIKQLKDEVNKNPLKAIDPNFSRSANSYASTLNGKGKNTGVIGGLEQISDRYTTDFNRTTQNYGKYATALKKLFDDMSKGADASLKTVLKDMERVNYLAERLTNATGIEQGQLLTKELDKRFDPSAVDAQSAAEAKATTSYENMLSKIEKRANEAQLRMQNIFGENGIENLGEKFVAGNVEGFDKFVENANNAQRSLTDLQGILEQAGENPAFLLQEGNVERLVATMGQLDTAIQNVSGNASKFEIADSLDVDKLRASATQFLRKESGLSVDEITQIQQVIDQLQGQINKTDFSHLKDQFEGIKQSAIEAGHTGGTFFDMLGQRFKSMAAYLLSFASFYRIIGIFKDGINIVKQLDSALVEMNKVSTESLATLREYQKESFSTANDVGTTATQLQQSTADFIRLGKLKLPLYIEIYKC